MHIWYSAVCDGHKQLIDVMVNNPKRTAHFLADDKRNTLINDWLERHHGCELRLIHRDDQLDGCLYNGYTRTNVLDD